MNAAEVELLAKNTDHGIVVEHLEDLLALHLAQDYLEMCLRESVGLELQLKQQSELPTTPDFPQQPISPRLEVPPSLWETAQKTIPEYFSGFLIAGAVAMGLRYFLAGQRDVTTLVTTGVVVAVLACIAWVGITQASQNSEVEKNNAPYISQHEEALANWKELTQSLRSDRSSVIANAENQLPRVREQIRLLNSELDTVTAVLNKSYSINLIPGPFRVTEAIYYLHQYLSTSRQTLSEALLHSDLSDIKLSIRNVVENQREQLIQQERTNALLSQANRMSAESTDNMGRLMTGIQQIQQTSAEAVRSLTNAEHYAAIGSAHLAKLEYYASSQALGTRYR